MQKKIPGQPEIFVIDGKKIPVYPGIVVSKDGSTLMSGGHVYDLTDKRNDVAALSILRWDEHATLYPSIAISPDGKYLVTAHIGLVFAPDTKHDYWGHGNYSYEPPPEPENLILVWDTATGEIVYRDSFTMVYKTPSSRVEVNDRSEFIHVEFLSNDKFVMVSESGEVAVWSVPLKKRIYALSASAVKAHIFVINHSKDKFVVLESNPRIFSSGHIGQQWISAGHLSGNERVLGSFGDTFPTEPIDPRPKLRFWTLADGRLIKEVEKPQTGVILSMHFSPDDTILAMNDHQAIYFLDVESGLMIDRVPIACKLIGFTEDGQNLLVQKDNYQVNVWNIKEERFYKNFAFPGELYYTQMVTENRAVVVTNEGKDSIVHVVSLGALLVE